MNRLLLTIAGTVGFGLIVTAAIVALLLPKILKAMGLHPDYDAGQKYELQGKKRWWSRPATAYSVNPVKQRVNPPGLSALK